MFTRGQAIEFIERCFGPARPSNGGRNVSVLCPVCKKTKSEDNKKKLVIETSTFVSHCWVCENKKTRNLFLLIRDISPELAKEFQEVFLGQNKLIHDDDDNDGEGLVHFKEGEEKPLELPKGYTMLAEWINLPDKPISVINSLNYLSSRGVSNRDLWFFKFGVTDQDPSYRNRVIIPSHDKEGNLNFFTSRSFDEKARGTKYLNPSFNREKMIFNELNINWKKELTIVEGPFDLLKVNENATCLLGSYLDEKYLLFQKIVANETPVVLALDNDARRKSYKIMQLLYEHCIPIRVLEIPREQNDVGQMSREQFKRLLVEAKIMDARGLMFYKLLSLK